MVRLILITMWRKLFRNPNTYSSLLGLVWWSLSLQVWNNFYTKSLWTMWWINQTLRYGHRWNVKMPMIIDNSIALLSDAGLGMTMFTTGKSKIHRIKNNSCRSSCLHLLRFEFYRFIYGSPAEHDTLWQGTSGVCDGCAIHHRSFGHGRSLTHRWHSWPGCII